MASALLQLQRESLILIDNKFTCFILYFFLSHYLKLTCKMRGTRRQRKEKEWERERQVANCKLLTWLLLNVKKNRLRESHFKIIESTLNVCIMRQGFIMTNNVIGDAKRVRGRDTQKIRNFTVLQYIWKSIFVISILRGIIINFFL